MVHQTNKTQNEEDRTSSRQSHSAQRDTTAKAQVTDNRADTARQKNTQEMIQNSPRMQQLNTVQRFVIQRHKTDNDVLTSGSLDKIISRIEELANQKGTIENLQERVTDLWHEQNLLLNKIRAKLEVESTKDESSTATLALNAEKTGYDFRLAMAKYSLEQKGINIPKTILYKSEVGTNTAYDNE